MSLLPNAAPNPRMVEIWSDSVKFQQERLLWLEVMHAQADLGVQIPPEALDAYARAALCAPVDLESIRRRELVLHHDVKARLEEFNALAGYQFAHLGMTGRDLDDNVELYLQRWSLTLLAHDLATRGWQSQSRDVLRLGRKVPFRGIVGALGTAQDQLDLLGGDHERLRELNEQVRQFLHLGPQLDSVGQVYPRSLDFQMASSLTATLGGLPAPQGAWPVLMRGYVSMLAELAGDQWAEGDVSCSSVRRVALPSLFIAASAWVWATPVNEAT